MSKPQLRKETIMRKSEVKFPILLLLAAGVVSIAGAQAGTGRVTVSPVKAKGTAVGGAGSPIYTSIASFSLTPEVDLVEARRNSVRNQPAASARAVAAAALTVPSPAPNSVTYHGVSVGFEGLTTVDTANTNGFVVTPPDQGLCAGHGFVLEIINLSLVVFNSAGARISAPQSANAFFAADPNTTFLSDPRCYYDAPTQRWFVVMTNILDTANNNRSSLLLAVSQTSDPRGSYILYSIDTSDDGLGGTPANPGCSTAEPCFGDQPLLGADANGIYITTNEFSLFADTFNGAEVYAISKSALEAGTATSLVHIGDLPLAEGPSYSLQPASSPDLSEEEGSGVEYFLSALDFTGTLDNRIAVWALTNTRSLSRSTPSVTLTSVVINSEVYGQPAPVTQKPGPYPLGQSLGEPEETIDSNDDRMNNVVFASGKLWGGVNTIVSDGTSTNTGIAYFVVRPSLKGGVLSASINGQGYVSVRGNSVLFPGIGVTAEGAAAAAFTVAGPGYYPSAAYAHLTPAHATGVNIVAAGTAPQDDFSGYPEYGGDGTARWGDYSWGVADGDSLWLATEYIPGGIDSVNYGTDFGTFIYRVKLD
jgi:hypothetical protein